MRNRLLSLLFLPILVLGLVSVHKKASATVNFTYNGTCIGSPTSFSGTLTGSIPASWKWSFGDGVFDNSQNPTHTYAAANAYTVKLVVTNTLGVKDSITKSVTINVLPTAFFSVDSPTCSSDSVHFHDLSFPNSTSFITRWVWNFGDGSPNDTVTFANYHGGVTHFFPSANVYFVTLQVMTDDSCVNQTIIPVTVIGGPTANFFFDGQCEDQIVKFTDASSSGGFGNIAYWGWSFDDPGSGINDTSTLVNPTHLFSQPGTYNVLLRVTSFNTCVDTIIIQVVIRPHPPVNFKYTATCLNELIHFSPDSAFTNVGAIKTWRWDFGDGGLYSYNAVSAHQYTTPGIYTVILTVTDTMGCMNDTSQIVTIHALPVPNFNAGLNNCAGSYVAFDDNSTTDFGHIVRWEWNFGDGNTLIVNDPGNPDITHLFTLAGTYYVTLTVKASDSCSNSQTQEIVIHPNPVSNFRFSLACFGSPVDFTDQSQLNGAGSIVQWQWNFGDDNSGTENFSGLPSPSHTFTIDGIFTVQLVVTTSNGCTDTLTQLVRVRPQPPVAFNTDFNCQNRAVQFTPDAVIMNIPTVPIWSWQFGDGGTSTTQNPTHVFTSPGNYPVILTITDTAGCTNTITKLITIIPEPIANFTYSQPACKQSAVEFINYSFAPLGYIVKCEWVFGDGGTLTTTNLDNVFHTYATYNTFSVTLKVTTNDSCTRIITLPVVIGANPLADFSYLTTCMGAPVQFNDLSQPGAGGLAGWIWDFGDPPSGTGNVAFVKNPIHVFSSSGIYPVTLIVTNTAGCQDTIIKPVTVYPLPVVDFDLAPGCVNDSTHFISSTYVSVDAIDTWLWDFGDGFTSIEMDPYHIYTTSGSFPVTLTITDTAGCINTKMKLIAIVPPPLSFFQISQQNCTHVPVLFTNLSTTFGGTFTSFFWDFGDGHDTLINAPATGNVSHTYTQAGNFTVILTVNTSLGCSAESAPVPLTISASPLALFSFGTTCAGSAVTFTDLSLLNAGTTLVNWLWDFGDPTSGTTNTSILQNPSHIYETPATYTVNLLVENASGCPDTVSHTLEILPKPTLQFSYVSTCLGTATAFTTNTTITNIGALATFDWDFGDGTAHNTTQMDPVHIYSVAGNYPVTLSIVDTSGCVNSISHLVSILPKPTAQFSYTSACLGAPTSFADQSYTSNGGAIANWHWDFGVAAATNDTSNQPNPLWVYTTLGVYNVNLIVTSENGCQDTVTTSLQVFGNPTANFNYTAAPCKNGAVYFQDSSYNQQAAIIGLNWEFEPNQYSTLQNPVYVFYYSDSCYNVRLIATDMRGCVDTIVKVVCVPASFDFTFTNTVTCFRDSTYFTPQLLAPTTDSLVFFNWNFGELNSGINNTSTRKNPSHYYSEPGTYQVSLESLDIHNCSKKVYRSVVVLPLPVPVFSFTGGVCDSTIYFNESSSGSGSAISRWIWNYGDGIIDTVFAPNSPDLSHLYVSAGLYSVGLTVTNVNGCTNAITDTNVLVKPCINAEFSIVDTLICQNNLLSFADSSYSGLPTTEWYWNFGDGTDTTYYSYVNPLNHAFTTPGTFTIRMRISTSVAGRKISDSTQLIVLVNPTPIPDFTFGVVCYKQTADFTNMTSGNGSLISNYNWNFGEPVSVPNDTSTLKNPTHDYKAPGTFNVKLVTKNTIGCTDSIEKPMNIYALPDAKYKYSLSCAGDNTAFTDASVEAVSPLVIWGWTFSDSKGLLGIRDVQNPDFTFNFPGDYFINLLVTDSIGCSDTITDTITTWPIPTSSYSYADNFNDVQGQLQFTNLSLNGIKYYWTFGNGDDSYGKDPVIFYKNDGTYDISLVTWNDKNCTDTLTMQYKFMVKGLYIPNAFSPNNPNKPVQLLKPVGVNLTEYRFEVYDRWGNMLWFSEKLDSYGRPTEGWDGTYNGVLLQEGAYVWKAMGIFKDGSIWDDDSIGNHDKLPKTKAGTATMIK
jgi:PKD repeat protein